MSVGIGAATGPRFTRARAFSVYAAARTVTMTNSRAAAIAAESGFVASGRR